MKVEINYRKTTRKSTNMWALIKTLLNNQWVNKKIKTKIKKKNLEINENPTCQNSEKNALTWRNGVSYLGIQSNPTLCRNSLDYLMSFNIWILCPTSHALICGHQVICNVYFDFPEAHSCWQYSAKKKLVSGSISLIFWKLLNKVPFLFCISASSIFKYRLCIHEFYKRLRRWTSVNLQRRRGRNKLFLVGDK